MPRTEDVRKTWVERLPIQWMPTSICKQTCVVGGEVHCGSPLQMANAARQRPEIRRLNVNRNSWSWDVYAHRRSANGSIVHQASLYGVMHLRRDQTTGDSKTKKREDRVLDDQRQRDQPCHGSLSSPLSRPKVQGIVEIDFPLMFQVISGFPAFPLMGSHSKPDHPW